MSKGRDLIDYRVTVCGTMFHFYESENEYFYQWKGGEDLNTVLFCDCTDPSSKATLASYHRRWNEDVSSAVINTFINKFLRDADYRREFLDNGNNICVVQEEQGLINSRCKKMIY